MRIRGQKRERSNLQSLEDVITEAGVDEKPELKRRSGAGIARLGRNIAPYLFRFELDSVPTKMEVFFLSILSASTDPSKVLAPFLGDAAFYESKGLSRLQRISCHVASQ